MDNGGANPVSGYTIVEADNCYCLQTCGEQWLSMAADQWKWREFIDMGCEQVLGET
jgi:hypothetical protein